MGWKLQKLNDPSEASQDESLPLFQPPPLQANPVSFGGVKGRGFMQAGGESHYTRKKAGKGSKQERDVWKKVLTHITSRKTILSSDCTNRVLFTLNAQYT